MTYDYINYGDFIAFVNAVEEEDVPECMKENDARGMCGTGDEEYFTATLHPHRSRSNGVSQYIDNLKET